MENIKAVTILKYFCKKCDIEFENSEFSKETRSNSNLGCDFAPKSVQICKELVQKYGDRGHIFEHDLASDVAIEIAEKVDVIICTFVLSALPFHKAFSQSKKELNSF